MKSLAKNISISNKTAPKQKAAIQPKLKLNVPGDKYEQEADAMAERVMHFSKESSQEGLPMTGLISRSIQRRSELGSNGNSFIAPTSLVSQLSHDHRGGSPLPIETRNFMENAFSADFACVRIHTDSMATGMSKSIQAKAFTYGEDIYFDEGEFNPGSNVGKELLAHELTHVIQQRHNYSGAQIQRRVNSAQQATLPQSSFSPARFAQLLINRLNTQSSAIQYRFEENSFDYTVIDEAALSTFDWQMRALLDLGDLFLIRWVDLMTIDTVPDSVREPQSVTDLNGLLASDDTIFQNLLIGYFNRVGEATRALDPPLSPVENELEAVTSPELTSDLEAGSIDLLEPEQLEESVSSDNEIAPSAEAITIIATEALPTETLVVATQPLLSPEPLMPEPPATLSTAAQGRLSQAQSAASSSAARSRNLPSDAEITAEARQGVTEPPEETQALVSSNLTDELAQRASPSPEIEQLCDNIQRAIRAKRPPDEDSLLSARPEESANEVGNQLNTSISSDADRVGGSYDQLENPPAGTAQQVGETPELPPNEFEVGQINAAGATPDPIPAADVSLDNDVQNTQSAMQQAGMTSTVAEVITDPTNPVVMAREAHGELDDTASQGPAQVLEEQNTAIANAQTQMVDLQAQALQALMTSRSGAVGGTGRQQTALIGTEEQKRAEVGRQAEAIFTAAQTNVDQLLQPLSEKAMEMWNTGKTRISTEFRQHLDRVQRWVDERHSGAGGFVLGIVDYVSGLPDWVTEEYNRAEQTFSDDICAKIREISTYVNTIILACEEIINNADRDITTVFENARGELGDWVDEQREGFATRIVGLRTQVTETRDNFNRDLATQAAETVQAVREEVHALRQAARGMIGRIADAIAEFVDDPVRFIINGLLSLVGIEPVRFWALAGRIGQVIGDIAADPLGFAGNLLSAIGNGFSMFFDHFGTHLIDGLIGWLFSGLGSMGIQVPRELSLSGIITFFLQLMGITWDRIRRLLAEQIGEENVALIEQAFEMVSNLIQMGPAGIFEMIKDMLNPQNILDRIIQVAIDFMVETIATQAAVRIALLFNPVGAIAQAIEAIYKILRWVFENASRIFTLVETVVNGIANIISGNTGAMSLAVEQALSGLMIPVIDFIAGFINLGGLPDKVADAVRGMQEWVEGLLQRAIRWMADQARALLQRLGFGEEEEGAQDNELENSEVGESINFSAEGEMHRLWISTEGPGVEIMVRSTPTTVDHKLTEWESRVHALPEESQSHASGLISTARHQYQTAKQEGSEAEQEIIQAQQNAESGEVDQAEQADREVESAEQALKNTLVQLFELFGEESLLEKYHAQLALVDEMALQDITYELEENRENYSNQTSWEGLMAVLISGNSRVKHLHDKPLGTAAHDHRFGQFNYDNQFKPGLSTAMNQEGKSDQDLGGKSREDYAANRTPVIHGSNPPEGEQASLTPRQAALSALQDQIFNESGRSASLSAIVAYFVKSLEGSTVHQEYTPQNIQSRIENGTLIVTYDYGPDAERVGGKRDFIASIRLDDVKERLVVQTTRGNRLRLKVPGTRGSTASSGKFGSEVDTGTVNIQSAHILADQFMGSGYKAALNLVLTSSEFNNVTMKNAEISMVRQIEAIQTNFQKPVTFNMTVEATWEALSVDPIIETLRRILPESTKNLNPIELTELARKTRESLVPKQNPRRCKQVNYIATVFGDGQFLDIVDATTAHEDIWLNSTFS